ncbi:hypothetical protein SLS62_010197 [Diatrype stigma]|uniref:Prolyl 4-hydroxylase alpha subunit domain-containing protein n=1 Tax=Diatrype stigma TaxID=117547 RepID=A0AAN9YIR5_9PEZI
MANLKPSRKPGASRLKPLGVTAIMIAALAVATPYIYPLAASHLSSLSPQHNRNQQQNTTILATKQQQEQEQENPPSPSSSPATNFTCDPQHGYTTEIVSLDPLLIYIRDFLSAAETAALLAAGEPAFRPSEVYKGGRKQGTPDRTSSSAALPRDAPAVACVLDRAARFLGSGTALFDPAAHGGDDIGPPQLVRYAAGQRFNIHHDWYAAPRAARPEDRWRGARWNRAASFFAVLEDGCEGGETWFPHVHVGDGGGSARSGAEDGEGDGGVGVGGDGAPAGGAAKKERVSSSSLSSAAAAWRSHEDGGVAFAPMSGNALFWVNLFPNGTGDPRTIHAGLPVESGRKTAMNIWPRKYYN